MISELDARLTLNARIINYVHDVVIDMTEKSYAQDAKITSQEKRYLTEFAGPQAIGTDTVRLAPSKLLREPPSTAVNLHLPDRIRPAGGLYKSYDIPWDLIDGESIYPLLIEDFKLVYIEVFCTECEKMILVPYMMPRKLDRICEEMEKYISLPQHFCIEEGWVGNITMAEIVTPMRHEWGRPSLDKCKWIEIYRGLEIDYQQFNCAIGSTEPKRETVVNIYSIGESGSHHVSLPMMFPYNSFHRDKLHLEAHFVRHYAGGHVTAKISFDLTDVMAATFVYTDLESALRYHHTIALPIHLKGFNVTDINMSPHPQEDLFRFGKYPYGDSDALSQLHKG